MNSKFLEGLLDMTLAMKDDQEQYDEQVEAMAKAAGFSSKSEYDATRRELHDKYPLEFHFAEGLLRKANHTLGKIIEEIGMLTKYTVMQPESLRNFCLQEMRMLAQVLVIQVEKDEQDIKAFHENKEAKTDKATA